MAKSGISALNFSATVDGGTVHLWSDMRILIEQQALRTTATAAEGTRKVEDHTFMPPPVSAKSGA